MEVQSAASLFFLLRSFVKNALGIPPKVPLAVAQCLCMASRRLLRQRSAEDIVALEVSAEPVAWMTDVVLVSFFE